MGHQAHRRALGSYAAKLIAYKSRQLVGTAGWTESDVEDLAEELVLEVLRRLPRFDPSRAKRDTLINQIVGHAVCDLIASRKAKMRDFRKCRRSLQDPVADGEGGTVEFGETLDGRIVKRRTGEPEHTEREYRDLRLELAEAIRDLPTHLRDLATRLLEKSVSQLAREMGVPRTTLLKRMQKIRERFGEAGLAEYLPNAASDSERSR